MGANTKIEWCDHTFNPWRGCTKIAPGCANCYAESQAKRNTGTLGKWGPNGTRVVAAESAWKQVAKWDRDAIADGESRSVFCGSMCDVLENWPGDVIDSQGNSIYLTREGEFSVAHGDKDGHREIVGMDHVRARMFRLIDATRLTWLLLTKRPQNIRSQWPTARDLGGYSEGRSLPAMLGNVWLGTSIACQDDAEKNIPELLKCRDLCAGLFLSIEPLIGPVDLRELCVHETRETYGLGGPYMSPPHAGIDQVIIGGESGPNARPCNVEWIRSIARQCEAAGVTCFVKQLGAHVIGSENEIYGMHNICIDRRPGTDAIVRWKLRDKKGGDPAEWPDDLQKYRSLAWKGGA